VVFGKLLGPLHISFDQLGGRQIHALALWQQRT